MSDILIAPGSDPLGIFSCCRNTTSYLQKDQYKGEGELLCLMCVNLVQLDHFCRYIQCDIQCKKTKIQKFRVRRLQYDGDHMHGR